MKIRMIPGLSETNQPNGISRVIEKYYEHGHLAGIEFTEGEDYDLKVSHAGITGGDCDVAILHGLYFTGDYTASRAEYASNAHIVEAIRSARAITVPSRWVSEIIRRDIHVDPFVVPHGIDYREWEHNFQHEKYVLYNKNRDGFDVCDSSQLDKLAMMTEDISYVSTFSKSYPSNVEVIGVQPPDIMKEIVQKAGVYASLTKETFGIGILEALASGVPVLGWRNGGNTDLVRHGVNGYLAEPDNYDDLASGLFYIIKYRKVLSQNAIETAKLWTWENAVKKLKIALDFAYAKKIEKPTVSIIMPAYNKSATIEKSLLSIYSQTLPVDKVVVVDDGSTDDTKKKIESFGGITAVYQSNSGVAIARNEGFKHTTSKYVCFLDADDEIDEDFIRVCVDALEKDNSLYIAYTKLRAINPDGTSFISGWPEKWNFDQQLKRKNQIPTCCVMRREVIERTGGFRQRYAPRGAGSEDADLWTRAGALGMKAALVTTEPLFIYHMGGATSSKDYREKDWLGWNGYISTRQHPIASYATPVKRSHNVYQYDNPKVSIIIPVGPGHEKDITEALDSIEGQTYKQWEAIVVSDTDKDIDLSPWPFVQLYRTPKPRSGPGVARNIGVNNARGGFIVFLDADDWLSVDAIEKMLIAWSSGSGIIYSDYYGIATVNPEDIGQFENRVVEYDEKKKRALIKHYSANFDCDKAQRQPHPDEAPYHWCIVTCLIPKAWHIEIGGFDEDMKSWEDVDYHWRMARAGKCYNRIAEHLVYYRFDTGNRRQLANPETNRQTASELLQYMYTKYERIKPMSCRTCGGNKSNFSLPQRQMNQVNSQQPNNDADFAMVLYNHPNKGEHMVIGPATGTKYGYRGGGDKFLVHRNDIALMPHIFVEASKVISETEAPRIVTREVAPPEPIAPVAPKAVKKAGPSMFDVGAVPGVTPDIADHLKSRGITTLKKFLKITEADLEGANGISPIRTKIIMDYVGKLKEKK